MRTLRRWPHFCAARYPVLPLIGLAAAAALGARTYEVRGLVVEVRPAEGVVVVSHRAIPGYMDAMVMPFRARDPREIADLKPGAMIEFELEVGRQTSRIRRIRPLRSAPTPGAGDLPDLTPPSERVPAGEAMPDFILTDQEGRPFRLSETRGRVVAVTFIYTRCPLPDVCPRLSAHFAYVQRRLAAYLPRDLTLLSITVDPLHDTPEVLARYGKIWGIRPPGWRLLTGNEAEVASVARRFGMVYWAEEGQIAHSTETWILGRDGRVAAALNGSRHTARQLADLIERQLRK